MANETQRGSKFHFGPGLGRRVLTGLSTYELMTTVALLSVVVGMAIPAYQGAIEKKKLTQGAERITAFLRASKSESIKRNRLLTVSYTWEEDGSWCIGSVLGSDPCDCSQADQSDPAACVIADVPWVLSDADVQAKNLIGSISGDGAYAFDPVRGFFINQKKQLVVGLSSPQGEYGLNLSMIATGELDRCVPQGSEAIGSIEVCGQEL